jgi:hypothetical protein
MDPALLAGSPREDEWFRELTAAALEATVKDGPMVGVLGSGVRAGAR